MKKQLAILTSLAIGLSGLTFAYAAPTDMETTDPNIVAKTAPGNTELTEETEGVGKKIEQGAEKGLEKTKEGIKKGGENVEQGLEKTKEGIKKGSENVEQGAKNLGKEIKKDITKPKQ